MAAARSIVPVFGGPPKAPAPAAAPAPQPAAATNEATAAQAAEEERRRRAGAGLASTVRTSPLGVSNDNETSARRVLLG